MSVEVVFEGATEPSLVIRIPGKAPPSLNTMLRAHWAVATREKKIWRKLLWTQLASYGIVKPFDKARICYTRYSPRMLDKDNLVGCFKYIQDQLVQLGVVRDDTEKVIRSWYKQESGPAATEIKVWGEYCTQRIDVRKVSERRKKVCKKKIKRSA